VSLDAENGIERPLLNPPHPLFKEISIAKAVKSDASASCPLNQAPAQSFPSRLAPIAKFSWPRSTSSGQSLWNFSMVHVNPELHPISAKLLGMFFFKTPTNSSS
jgi:hypothetical protein